MSKSKRHHWFPEGLSKFWLNKEKCINRIDVKGNVISLKPNSIGVVGNAHFLHFSEIYTDWNTSFEEYFQKPDDSVKEVLQFLFSLPWCLAEHDSNFENRLLGVKNVDVEKLNQLSELILSLTFRLPTLKERYIGFINSIRKVEFKTNNEEKQKKVPEIFRKDDERAFKHQFYSVYHDYISQSKNSGNFIVLISEEKEFIFGDGVYSNLSLTPAISGSIREVLYPLHPNISVIYFSGYDTILPKLTTINLSSEEVDTINNGTQVYSDNYLHFKNDKPILIDAFLSNKPHCYEEGGSTVGRLINLTRFLNIDSVDYGD